VSSNLAVAAVGAGPAHIRTANPCANDAALRRTVHELLAGQGWSGVDEVYVRGRRHRLDMAGMLNGMLCGFELKADNDAFRGYAIKRAQRDRASGDWSWSLASATSPRRSSECRDGGAFG
jgi:hypothetical protein